MLMNRSTISRAFPLAAAVSVGAMSCAYAEPTTSVTTMPSASQVVRMDAYRAMRVASCWTALRGKLDLWKSLPFDWDGENGIAPPVATIAACHDVLNELESVDAPAPIVLVAGDGEIAYEWNKHDGFASISVTADGSLIAFLREPGFDEPLRIDEPFTAEALQPFLDRIGAFA